MVLTVTWYEYLTYTVPCVVQVDLFRIRSVCSLCIMIALVYTLASSALATPSPRSRVVISGGTHGNEYTGIYVLQRLAHRSAELATQHPSLAIETLFANPEAHAVNRRFIDVDLNRQFSAASLADSSLQGHEASRAREIAADLGPKGPWAAADMLVDMHTTTANMGCTIIVGTYCDLALRVAAYVQQQWDADFDGATGDAADGASSDLHGDSNAAPAAATRRLPPRLPLRILLEHGSQEDAGHLASVARSGIEIEVGPTPQSMLRADCVYATEHALRLILTYLERHHAGAPPLLPRTLPAYEFLGKVPFVEHTLGARLSTLQSALPGAMVALQLQDRDFAPLRTGDPLYESLDGSIVPYDGSHGEVVCPVFINEAAYYYSESGRGIGMARRIEWPVPAAASAEPRASAPAVERAARRSDH